MSAVSTPPVPDHLRPAGPFRQPKAVFAVAFACVVSFMGIGLVDPILPALSSKLHATPSHVELLFTSYLVITALAMLITGTCWGLLVGAFAVFGAPRIQARLRIARALHLNLALFALDVLIIGLFIDNTTVIIVATIVSGVFIGTNNTITTQAVMTIAPVERPIASASYGFIRFIGGGIAPWAAGKIAASHGDHLPFYIGAAAILASIAVLASGRRLLDEAEAEQARAAVAHAHDARGVELPEALDAEATLLIEPWSDEDSSDPAARRDEVWR